MGGHTWEYLVAREEYSRLEADNAQLRAALAKYAAETMRTRIELADSIDLPDAHKLRAFARRYTASDGSVWHLQYDPKPIPTRRHDWSAVHDNYDGPDDHRYVHAATLYDLILAVEEYLYENPEERREAEEA